MPRLDPHRYVVAVSGGYAVLPFSEHVGDFLHPVYTGEVLTSKEVLECVAALDISLVVDWREWSVSWMHGGA